MVPWVSGREGGEAISREGLLQKWGLAQGLGGGKESEYHLPGWRSDQWDSREGAQQ